MRQRLSHAILASIVSLTLVSACSTDPTGFVPVPVVTGVQVINGFDSPVDIVIDGVVARSGLAAGDLGSFDAAAGNRMLQVRRTGGAAVSLPVQVTAGHATSVAATRMGGGALALQSLDDSNAVVPAGATKLRVLHLAANAGEVQVWRTQPDYQTPIRWAFPFNYNTANVYYQSTPGTWEVRVWLDTATYPPGDARGWLAALDAARVTLDGGGKKTVVILDDGAGRVKLRVID